MKVIQLTVFIENKIGRLLVVTKLLAEHNINIRSLCVADTSEYGLVRLIVDKPEEAKEILKSKGIPVKTTEIIVLEISDNPGGLSDVLTVFSESNINIEYLYAFVGGPCGKSIVGFKVDDINNSIDILSSKGLKILNSEEVYNM